MPRPDLPPTADARHWFLEVIRGAQPGATYPLDGAEVDLGNGPSGTPGLISLASQEAAASPRRMAPRHAALIPVGGSGSGWTVRDHETPGGTFVNNRRVLPGVAQPVASGDILQLGSVQVRLVAMEAVAPTAPSPGPAPFLYRSSTGSTCRSWDDFLPLSAQHWDELRADLAAGRLAEFARAVGRPDLAPAPARPGESADERLDAWLGRLPTRAPAAPELEVHPVRVVVAVATGGVTVRRRVQVSNVGHRLLRATVAVAPGSEGVLSLAPEVAGQTLSIREGCEVAFEVAVPESLDPPVTGELIINGAGRTCRVAIRVERRAEGFVDFATGSPGSAGSEPAVPERLAAALRAWQGLSLGKRLALGALVGPLARLQAGVLGGALGDAGLVASGPDTPALGLEAAVLALVGAVLGWWAGRRPGGGLDSVWTALGGLGVGLGGALGLVASCRAIEPILGPWATSIPAVLGLWVVLGVGLTLLGGGRPAQAGAAPTPEEVAR